MILTPRQEEARDVLNGPAKHILLEGGSRSGKTALTVRNVVPYEGAEATRVVVVRS